MNHGKKTKNFKLPAYYNLGLLFDYQQGNGLSLEEIARSVQYDTDTVNEMISFFEHVRDMNIDITKQLHDNYLDGLGQQIKLLEELLQKNMKSGG